MTVRQLLKKTKGLEIILGSSSQFRQAVLGEWGIPFRVIAPEIEEKLVRTHNYLETSIMVSFAKMVAVRQKIDTPAIIITCDQVIVCGGDVLEKPDNSDQAKKWYKTYTKKPFDYVNGITVYNTKTKKHFSAHQTSTSIFHSMPSGSFISKQAITGNILNCCGGLSSEVEEKCSKILSGTKESVIGLPVEFILYMITQVL